MKLLMFVRCWEKSRTSNYNANCLNSSVSNRCSTRNYSPFQRELRKFQLTKTLLTAPRVLIMDNPFIGLDAPTRELLFSLLERLTKMSSVQIILVLSMLDDIPSFITHVIPVDKMEVFPKMEREAYLEAFRSRDVVTSFDDLQQRIIDLSSDGKQLRFGGSSKT